MPERTSFTTITPLPPQITRQTAIAHLHDHLSMIDLNPLVQSRRHLPSPPPHADPSDLHCSWYSVTDHPVPGLPATRPYTAAYRNLPRGLETHAYGPLGLDIRETWTVGGSLPGEPFVAADPDPALQVPRQGLYVREDVEIISNGPVPGYIRKLGRKSHAALVDRMAPGAGAEASRTHAPASSVQAPRGTSPPCTAPPFFLRAPRGPPSRGPSPHPTAPSFFQAPRGPPPPSSAPPFLQAPRGPPPPVPASPSAVPPFLQAPRAPGPLRVIRPQSHLPAPHAPPPLKPSRPQSFQPASSTPTGAYPAPLRLPGRHPPEREDTMSSLYSPTPDDPSSLPPWARDAAAPAPARRPQSEPQRKVSVVTKYPDAHKQDYSDIAAMNPFDSPVELSPASSFDSFLSDLTSGDLLSDFPPTLASDSDSPWPESPGEMPPRHPRFSFDSGSGSGSGSEHGLSIGIPGEEMEEKYAVLEARLPVLVDRRSSRRSALETTAKFKPSSNRGSLAMTATLNGPSSYELY
ncbi:uncharacterized protein DNG_01071 [Cephalotrichum gorgonifer]|uniref:DUF7053 domain-containing protein n=1 Tax=Cephalotrichum gorgonifer TaxID=2041049 RepID=A0AAE8SRC9_9PEZI|nr:uncharacterized protein DNG_01071 [Cephalotrichum gorgonifer]